MVEGDRHKVKKVEAVIVVRREQERERHLLLLNYYLNTTNAVSSP